MTKKYLKIGITVLTVLLIGWIAYIYLYPRYVNWQLEEQLLRQPLFKVIKEYHPQEFETFLVKIKSSPEQNKREAAANYSAELINAVFYQHLEKAPDDYIELYLKSTIALYQYLNGLSPNTILKLENIEVADPNLTKVWEDKQFRNHLGHLLDTKRHIIESSARLPAKVPTEEQAKPLISKVIKDLEVQFTPETVRAVFANQGKDVDPKVAANVIIQFYNLILSSGKENAGIMLRYMAHLKNEPPKPSIVPPSN